jgi:hypothetical protein
LPDSLLRPAQGCSYSAAQLPLSVIRCEKPETAMKLSARNQLKGKDVYAVIKASDVMIGID